MKEEGGGRREEGGGEQPSGFCHMGHMGAGFQF